MSHSVLFIGVAGYIGSHACKALAAMGYLLVTVDNLCVEQVRAVQLGALVKVDIADRAALDAMFREHRPLGVLHFAAHIQVGESVRDPGKYYGNNIVFYFHRAHGVANLRLCYLNDAGVDPDGDLSGDHEPETHLIPLVLRAVLCSGPALTIFSQDYETPGGTCVPGYIHGDLARAHLTAEVVPWVTSRDVPLCVGARREGDPSVFVDDPGLPYRGISWTIQHPDLDAMIAYDRAWVTRPRIA